MTLLDKLHGSVRLAKHKMSPLLLKNSHKNTTVWGQVMEHEERSTSKECITSFPSTADK